MKYRSLLHVNHIIMAIRLCILTGKSQSAPIADPGERTDKEHNGQ